MTKNEGKSYLKLFGVLFSLLLYLENTIFWKQAVFTYRLTVLIFG